MDATFVIDGGAKDFAHLFFCAAAMKARTPLELEFHVCVKPAYHQLSHH